MRIYAMNEIIVYNFIDCIQFEKEKVMCQKDYQQIYDDYNDPCIDCPDAEYCDPWDAAVCTILNPDADPWDI